MRNDGKFKTALANVPASKLQRRYNTENMVDLDISVSVNKIGELVNMSQILNTILWDRVNGGCSIEDVADIYDDVSILNVMSQLEIDRAKREYAVKAQSVLDVMRKKYDVRDENGKLSRPLFFGFRDRQKGYWSPNKDYTMHQSAMDMLQRSVNSFVYKNGRAKDKSLPLSFSALIDTSNFAPANVTRTQVARVINIVRIGFGSIRSVYASQLSAKEKFLTADGISTEMKSYIGRIKMTHNTVIALLKALDDDDMSDIRKIFFEALFSYPNKSFYDALKRSEQPVALLEPDDNGDVVLFGYRFNRFYG